jgi:hypothetical protein
MGRKSIYRVDWDLLDENADLEGDYQTDMAYDGMGRPTTITLPQDVSGGRKLVTPSYNRSGAMESIALDGTAYVSRIAYNAKGQKILMEYGNGLMTRHAYDPVNFGCCGRRRRVFRSPGLLTRRPRVVRGRIVLICMTCRGISSG